MSPTTRATTIVVSGALILSTAACGGGGTGATAPPSSPPSSPLSSPTQGSGSHHTRATHTPSSPGTPAATEFNPPGDIPDNQVFLDFAVHGVHVRVPEGWAKKSAHGTTTFTDHYNSVSLGTISARHAPSVTSAKRQEVPSLSASVSKFHLQRVIATTRAGQRVVEIDYLLDSAQDPVTGKVVRDAAQRFEFFRAGREAVLTLTGPQNADNVDPWRLVSNSLRWH